MRTLTAAQTAALASADRATFVRVKVEDPDSNYVSVDGLYDEDFLSQVAIDANLDSPISGATITLFRKAGAHSIAPLDENSVINRDSAGSYAPFVNPGRGITVEVATLMQGSTPAASDWVQVWDGIIDEVDWGGRGSQVVLRCRDRMSRLNDTFIETVTAYGNDSATEDIEDVMQEILTTYISSPAVTLNYTATAFPVFEYDLGNVSVLDALLALRDLIGWNLTWKWTGSAFGLVLWEPNRSNTTADYTFGPDDYFMLPRVSVSQEGIRNKGEVVYLTTAGTVASATDTRTSSVTLYSTRFIRVDARGTSVVTATQAADLLANVLDDLEEPAVQQEVELPFFWPVELGDLYAFSPNDHYSTEQKWGVFGFRHLLSNNGPRRTILTVSGKPSGGYERWHRVERKTTTVRAAPSVGLQVSQTGSTGSMDLTISDPDLTITNVQFAEKTDAGSYGALATTWDRTTGLVGIDRELTRGEDITLAAKHNVSVRYVVTYDDGNGSKTLEGAHSFDNDFVAEVTHIEVTFNADGEAVVSATGDEDTANMYVTVGDGSAPSDPTSGTNDGSISGRNGTVDTGVKITTGNDAYVKVIGYNSTPSAGPVRSTRKARRLGPLHKDTTTRSHTGDTTETTLETITIPANTLGANGSLRIELRYEYTGTAGNKTLRVKLNSTTIFGSINTSATDTYGQVLLFNDGSTNAQQAVGFQAHSSGSVDLINNTSLAEDSTSAMNIVITAQLGNAADQIDLVMSHVQYIGTD